MIPVDVLEPQIGDLAGPKPIDGKQQQNRAVADVKSVVGSRLLDQPVDVIPRGAER